MKTKDINWFNEKIESIRKRKRIVSRMEDTSLRRKLKGELKREQRAAKRTEKNTLKKWIDNEINGLGN